MLNVLLDGFSIFFRYIVPVSLFFGTAVGCGLEFKSYLKVREEDGFSSVLFGIGGGVVVLIVLTFILFVVGYYLNYLLLPGGFVIPLFAFYFLSKWVYLGGLKKIFIPQTFTIGLTLFLLLIVRLAFLKYILLPPYSDSPIHYQIISGFLQPEKSNIYNLSLSNILSNYYHFGFHVLTAWLTLITGKSVGETISLVGQIFLIIAPVSVALFTYSIIQEISGAIYAGLLAAIGWSMPAFSVNWGKFPALSAIAIAPAVVVLAVIIGSSDVKRTAKIFWIIFLMGGLTLLHTRILICFALASIAFFLANRITLESVSSFFRSVRFALLYVILLVPFANQLNNFYSAVIPLILCLFLLPFAFQKYTRLFIGIFLYTFLMWFTMWASEFILGQGKSLLDKQFVEVMLYIPFSVMAGAGFAGLITKLISRPILQRIIYVSFVGAIVLQSLFSHTAYPDNCCDYFRPNDQNAFNWIMENTPKDSLFLISTFEDQGKVVGTDAGIWIYLLTGRPTNNIPFDIDWAKPEELINICNSRARNIFIYSGGRDYSFPNEQLKDKSTFHLIFQSGMSVIYQVVTCTG